MANVEPTPLARIARFENLGYGLFLHWGLYSLIERGEWAKHHRKIDWETYSPLKDRFTAEKWNPDALVKFAKSAGMKYVCLTTRHHDGFSLYDTRGLNQWDAPHSAAGRDLVAEYAAACHANDMAMFFYHTTLDWWHPAFDANWDEYLQYLNASVETIAKHYGPVAGFWFDGNWARKDRDWKENDLYGVCRKYHPECIIVNNSSTGARGQVGHPDLDVVTFEQGRPGKINRTNAPKYLAAEMCETLNSHWGIATRDYSLKSPADIITTLAGCRRFGANLLLNVGPTAAGELPGYERELLAVVGRWINTCAPMVHAARPTALVARGNDFVVQDGATYYYFLHNLPIYGNHHLSAGEPGSGLKTIAGKLPAVKSMTWTDNGEALEFSQDVAREMFTFKSTDWPYGENMVVRVAKIETGR